MKKLVIITAILLISCTSDSAFEKGKKQLENQGYTNVKNTGFSAFCCGEEDTFSTGFTAIGKNGEQIEGCFCSGMMKGVTIRFK